MNVCCTQLGVVMEPRARIPTAHIYATVAMVTAAASVTSTLTTASKVRDHFTFTFRDNFFSEILKI